MKAEGILIVPKAGETLYRLQSALICHAGLLQPGGDPMSEDATFPILSQSASASPGVSGRRRLEEVALLLSAEDNVAVAREDFARGLELAHFANCIVLQDAIPAGHKFAIREIPQGSPVTKYSHEIGNALYPIRPGEWVHTHNVQVEHDLECHEYPVRHPVPVDFPPGAAADFSRLPAWRRKGGHAQLHRRAGCQQLREPRLRAHRG